MQKALFLDRDGVINIDRGYVHKTADFEFVPGVFESLRRAQSHGYQLIVVTNQSGIARGLYTEEDFQVLNQWMLKRFEDEGVSIARVYHCPFHVDGIVPELAIASNMRKPEPGMLIKAQEEFHLHMADSIMVGDRESDIEAGRRASVGTTVRVSADCTVQSAADAVIASIADLPAALGW